MRRNWIWIVAALSIFGAAMAWGYLLSTRLGRDLLRDEAEKQLSRLMKGEVAIESVRLRLGLNLKLEGENAIAYPASPAPGLRVDHMMADIDVTSLLLGKLRLDAIWLDGVELRLARDAGGRWSFPPLAKLQAGRPEREEGDLEVLMSVPGALEATARVLLDKPLVAADVHLRGGVVDFEDEWPRASGGEPVRLKLRDVAGHLEHRWLAGTAALSVSASLQADGGGPTAVVVEGRKRRGDPGRLELAVQDLPLPWLHDYGAALVAGSRIEGALTGSLVFETPERGRSLLDIDWVARDLVASIPRHDDNVQVDSERTTLRARIETQPERVRVSRFSLDVGPVDVGVAAVMERPLRVSSRARLSVQFSEMDLPEVRRVIDWLPESDRETLTQLFARVEQGEIRRFRGDGTARLSDWGELLAGDLSELPPQTLLSAELADLEVGTGEGYAPVTGVHTVLEWSGNRIDVRADRAIWNGVELPVLNLSIQGVSHIFAGPREQRVLVAEPGRLAGLGELADLVDALGSGDPSGPPPPTAWIEIDALHHPLLRWPVTHAQTTLRPTQRGFHLEIGEAIWAGAPIRGDVNWVRDPQQLSIIVEARPPLSWPAALASDDETAPDAVPDDRSGPGDPRAFGGARWATGRVEIGEYPAGRLPFSRLRGEFVVEGALLRFSSLRADLLPSGTLEGRGSLGLGTADMVAVEAGLTVVDGDANQLAQAVGLPPDTVTGRAALSGFLEGQLQAELPLVTELNGEIAIDARDGEVRRDLPLVVVMARATEGFNPFAKRDQVVYENVKTVLQLERGRVSTEDFKLEGPMRVFASGYIDVGRPPGEIDAVVGVFLFRQADLVLGGIPLIKNFFSDKGLIGAYFAVTGPWEDPEAKGLPLPSMVESLPDALKTPFKALTAIRDLMTVERGSESSWSRSGKMGGRQRAQQVE